MLESKVNFGENVKVVAQDECHAIIRIQDDTGDGIMTIYTPFKGVYLSLCDMHMPKCESQLELGKGMEALCIDHCREGRIESEIRQGVFSILQEKQVKIDDRKYHKGRVVFPLKHFHGMSVMFDIQMAQNSIKNEFSGFEIDLIKLRQKFCSQDKPCILKENGYIENLMKSLYFPPNNVRSQYYQIKVIELLLYLDSLDADMEISENGFIYGDALEKVKMIYKQITENLSVHYTIQELAEEYSISGTVLKKCFKEVYGDSIYSYIKRYRMNVAASLLSRNENMSVSEIANSVGYESSGKFAAAFKSVMGISPLQYRKNGLAEEERVIDL
jgi:AraC-like DNA-binding protein